MISSCASIDDNPLESIENIFSSHEEPHIVPQGPAYSKPVVLVPQDYHKQAPTMIKPIMKPAISKQMPTEKTVKPFLKANKSCMPEKFKKQRTVSGLYQTYLKENKACTSITSQDVASAFTAILAQNYATQDVRLLNADVNFLKLYASAIKNAERADKVMLNKQIVSNSCHLLKPTTCSYIKKSLY
jgi:hypothetical protein